ncbi:MAG: hypothetical protein TEF_04505 [Rhizobiales bacterium NRL2]|jgi:alkylation response protein AidB-like acyl-CoA dehydrogenase|nr:MAG: hypothetical protein TEF_04505 [Rhizobiales bacterium NRL2]
MSGRVPAGPGEADFHDFWREAEFGRLDPVDMAVEGGRAALSLPQVFIAGYQASLRKVFPDLPAAGWAALAAAEDRKDPERFPGTVLTADGAGFRLDGCKSWIGQSRHVRHLLVTAKLDGEVRIARLPRDRAGVTITHREGPGFLRGLSQGFGRFERVAVAPGELMPGEHGRDFARAERLYVMLACAAFLEARSAGAAQTPVDGLAAYCAEGRHDPARFAALDRDLQAAGQRFGASAAADAVPDWIADRGLIAMYSRRIQERDPAAS